LAHLGKKHELADVHCKDFMRHFIHGLSPKWIDIPMKTGDGVTVNRLWDVERYPCLGCDDFYNRRPNVEITPKSTRRCLGTWKHWHGSGIQSEQSYKITSEPQFKKRLEKAQCTSVWPPNAGRYSQRRKT
jgi:hypothetical protein